MQVSWDNRWYEAANQCAQTSSLAYEMGENAQSLKTHCQARAYFLCDAVMSACLIPFAAIQVVFGLLHSGVAWDRKKLVTSWRFFEQKCNHLLLSVFGATLSPKYANLYRDSRWPVYIVGVIRGTLVTSLLIYYGLMR